MSDSIKILQDTLTYGSISATGNLTVSGDGVFNGSIKTGSLTAVGASFLNGNCTVSGNSVVTGTGTFKGNTLTLGDQTGQILITNIPTTSSYPTAQRMILQGVDGYASGEGTDLYIWAGNGGYRSQADDMDPEGSSRLGSGGDIKVDAGRGQDGGTIKIRGGYSQGAEALSTVSGGFVLVEAGNSQWGYGGNVNMTAGYGPQGGGTIGLTTRNLTQTNVWTFSQNGTLSTAGSINLASGSDITRDGVSVIRTDYLPLSGGTLSGALAFDPNGDYRLENGMGFHLYAKQGISIETDYSEYEDISRSKSFNFNQNGGLILDQTQVAAMASMWFTLYPAEDSGFGLTTPNGVTHLFEYDYDNVSSATYPIQVRPAEDNSLSGVALSTVAAINATNLFDAYYKDRDGMPYIYIYQKTTGISGNRTNTNFFNNSITGFTGGEGSSITFNDGSVQTTAFIQEDYLPLSGGNMTGAINFSASRITQGLYDSNRGGLSGISLVCSLDYDFNWQVGWITALEQDRLTPRPLYVDSGAGSTIRAWTSAGSGTEVSHIGITFPDSSVQTSAINKFVSAFGNTSDTSYVLTHNLSTEDVTVTVIEVATKSVVYPSVTNTSLTQITVDFSEIPASANSYKAIVIG